MDEEKEINAKSVIFYVCPHCESKNTIGLHTINISSGFKCKNCSKINTCDSLALRYLEQGRINREFFNDLCVQFNCPCGQLNIIFNKIISRDVQTEFFRIKTTITSESPVFGLCESCMSGYKLVYKKGLFSNIDLIEP